VVPIVTVSFFGGGEGITTGIVVLVAGYGAGTVDDFGGSLW
jgi:hypothetical protein